MKLWLAHKVGGEDYKKLKEEMKKVCGKLQELGIDYYCSFLESEVGTKKSKEELIQNAFRKINEFDGTLAIIKSIDLSEGMLIEIGYTLAKEKNFILAIKKGIMERRYVRVLANKVIEFEDLDDLLSKLEEIKQ
jgi:nucleoside 2-deoxyribosyltransferase